MLPLERVRPVGGLIFALLTPACGVLCVLLCIDMLFAAWGTELLTLSTAHSSTSSVTTVGLKVHMATCEGQGIDNGTEAAGL